MKQKVVSKKDIDEFLAGKKINAILDHGRARRALRSELNSLTKQDGVLSNRQVLFSRNVNDDDSPFITTFGQFGILEPPFDFDQLFKFYEESDTLQQCVEAMINNVVGFGFQFDFLGDDLKEKENPQAKKELQIINDFFNQVNDKENYTSLNKKVRKDFEITGNSAIEVIRDIKGDIAMLHHLPIPRMRMTRADTRPVTIEVPLRRGGVEVMVKVRKRFRRFAKVGSSDSRKVSVRWFKEFGDPRVMLAKTGEFLKKGKKPPKNSLIASEVIWRKQALGDQPYGLPRWIGSIVDVVGRRQAGVVNFDLFQNQGIPPMAIMTNGMLTDDSIEELKTMILGARGVAQWNKILLLEVTNDQLGLEDKGANSKLELKNLSDFRKEDLMFGKYLEATARFIRQSFRLPDLYIGGGSEIALTFAAAKAAQTIAEEQVFVPERQEEEELINKVLVSGAFKVIKWVYKQKGPQLAGGQDITTGASVFNKAGALTVNQSIKLANRLFGSEISPFENKKWADFPMVMVMELLKKGELKDIEEIREKPKENPTGGKVPFNTNVPLGGKQPQNKKLPPGSKKWSGKEKSLYGQLLLIKGALESVDPNTFEEQTNL